MNIRLRQLLRFDKSQARSEAGVTLVELIVSIGLFGILATLIVSSFTIFSQTLSKDRIATENINVATVGMNQLTRVVRASTSVPQPGSTDKIPFELAEAEQLTLYAYIDTNSSTPKPVKIRFAVNTTTRELTETRWIAQPRSGYPSYWDFPATASSSKVIARRIVVPAAGEAPMFSYYKIKPDLTEELMVIPAGGLVALDRAKIAVIEVRVKVQSDDRKRAAPATIVNRVGIPNLGISRLGTSTS